MIFKIFCCLIFSLYASACEPIRRAIVDVGAYEQKVEASQWKPVRKFSKQDQARLKIDVSLKKVGEGFEFPVDMQFIPGAKNKAIVLEKGGALKIINTVNGNVKLIDKITVETASEQGLLGAAFHPKFTKNNKLYLNYITKVDGKDVTRIAEYFLNIKAKKKAKALKMNHVVIDVKQPYQNHNAGQIAFGPDGYLYVGFGDGGWANDPHSHGQSLETILGNFIRIDVDKKTKSKNYTVPADNPYATRKGAHPEIWARGLRNPWRFSFDPNGRLIVADVGQNDWEEVSIVEKGRNYGWSRMEAHRCFPADTKRCHQSSFNHPVLAYNRKDGQSITGGYVYTGKKVPKLKNLYLFGDFASGNLWAAALPKKLPRYIKTNTNNFYALGNWDLNISSFAQDKHGEVYILAFTRGIIYQVNR